MEKYLSMIANLAALMIKSHLIQLQKSTLVVHDLARNPYLFSLDISNAGFHRISPEAISVFQVLHPVQVIQIERNVFQFFAGWFWLEVCRRIGVESVLVVIHEAATTDEIQRLAWFDLLSHRLMVSDRTNYLTDLVKYIDAMPINLRRSLMGRHYSYSANVSVQKLTGETRSAIQNQLKKYRATKNSTSTIFNELIGEADGDE